MNDEVKNEALQDLAVEAEAQEQAQVETPEIEAQEEVAAPAKKVDQSFRELRNQKEEIERRLEDANRYIREIEARNRPATPEEPVEPEPSDGDLVEWKHVKRHIKQLKDELGKVQQQSAQQQEESRLRNKYPDIDSVVTVENMAQLRRSDPEAAAAIDSASGLYAKGLIAYRFLKSSESVVEQPEYQKINKNANRPKTIATVNSTRGQTPLNNANEYMEFTDAMAEQLRKEMEAAIKVPRN